MNNNRFVRNTIYGAKLDWTTQLNQEINYSLAEITEEIKFTLRI